ncbi:hypothetical protein V6N13_144620 [Hibiscus sabdariffa]|uniref:Uncharacterized protein n=1 Tax=Hibiscus sabdariffa TaxID=183260 RepID=A0ABR2FLN8_9ROSI
MKGIAGEGGGRGRGTQCADRETRRLDRHGKQGVGHGVTVGGRFGSYRNRSRRRSRLPNRKVCRRRASGQELGSLSCTFGRLIEGGFAASCLPKILVISLRANLRKTAPSFK